jgi:hypothetical protein
VLVGIGAGDQVDRQTSCGFALSSSWTVFPEMKKFFNKALKGTPSSNPKTTSGPAQAPSPPPSSLSIHRHSLAPKFTVPPVPHPSPHSHLALLATDDALLIRPHAPGVTPEAHVRIAWGKGAAPEEVSGSGDDEDWSASVVVYGIIGIMALFDGVPDSSL